MIENEPLQDLRSDVGTIFSGEDSERKEDKTRGFDGA
jgi:hypothetical protein